MPRHMCEEPSTYDMLMRCMPNGTSGECSVKLCGVETVMLLNLVDNWLDEEPIPKGSSIEASLRWRWHDAPRKDLGPRFCEVATDGSCHLSNRVVVSTNFREPQQLIDELSLHLKKLLLIALFKSLTIGGCPESHHYIGVDCLDTGEDPLIFFHKYYFGTRWKLSEIVVNDRIDFDRAKLLVDAELAQMAKAKTRSRRSPKL